MQNSNETIYFNFSYFALKLLGKGLYSNVWTAIAELVANGFDAKATKVKIYINAIDKEHSTIEIFDNGYGMDYAALAEKYVLIGKDKRDDDKIDEKTKNELMGRKGIGKLAALYLSNKYYLVSKTQSYSSAWCLNAANSTDSDIPHLDRVDVSKMEIESNGHWNKFKTGTLIKLTNVDLSYFGAQSLAGLKARLSDFYLLNSLQGSMEVAFLTSKSDKIEFEKVEKNIAFKNFYAFYNNTETDYSKLLSKEIRMKSQVEDIEKRLRKVIIFDEDEKLFSVSGKKRFITKNGTLSKVEFPYKMSGWIGIHSTISKEEAIKNDPEYLKNKAYRPNQLRLYVRNKLAVENFLDYVKNTQAFSNYIEGEISFDILDDNDLPDIATSNRQGFVEDDERVQLLIEILNPIISALIRERVKLGHTIRDEEKRYHDQIAQMQEEERKKEEEARIKAEKDRKKAIREKEEVVTQNITLNKTLDSVRIDLGSEKKRSDFLLENLSADKVEIAKQLHMAKINNSTINTIIHKLVLKHSKGMLSIDNIWDDIKKISFHIERIKANLNYCMNAKFNTQEEKIEADLFDFITDYCSSVLTKDDISVSVEKSGKALISFVPQDVAVVLENIYSNSQKARASEIAISLRENKDCYLIDFTDNGTDTKWKKIENIDDLFEFGKGCTVSGSGVGLYHIREVVQSMNGKVSINKECSSGFELNVRLEK